MTQLQESCKCGDGKAGKSVLVKDGKNFCPQCGKEWRPMQTLEEKQRFSIMRGELMISDKNTAPVFWRKPTEEERIYFELSQRLKK